MSNCMRVTFTALSPALPRSPVPASPSIPSGSLALIAPRADHPSHNTGPSTWSQQNQNKRKRIDSTDSHTSGEGRESKRAKAEVAQTIQEAAHTDSSLHTPASVCEESRFLPQQPRISAWCTLFDDDAAWSADLMTTHEKILKGLDPYGSVDGMTSAGSCNGSSLEFSGYESAFECTSSSSDNTPFADQVNPWSSAPGEEFLYLEDAVTTVDIDASPKPVKLLRRSRAHSTCTAAPPPTRYRKSTYPPVRPSPLRQDITQALLTPSEEDEEKDEYDEYVVCESEFLAAGTALAEAEIFKLVDVNLWGRD